MAKHSRTFKGPENAFFKFKAFQGFQGPVQTLGKYNPHLVSLTELLSDCAERMHEITATFLVSLWVKVIRINLCS